MSAGKERRKRKKKAMVALLVFVIATLEIVFDRKKNCWTQKVHLAITFSKIAARYSSLQIKVHKIHFSYIR